MSSLQMKFDVDGTVLFITLGGNIDEDSKFKIPEFAGIEQIHFDMMDIKIINSCGIRDWVQWLDIFPANLNFYFRNCPQVFIEQVNLIEGMLPKNGFILSFMVPYYQEEKGLLEFVIFEKNRDFPSGKLELPEEMTINGDVYELDVISNRYLKFLFV